jgi:hypothetical protein
MCAEYNDYKLPGLTTKFLSLREEFVCTNADCTFYICYSCFSSDFTNKLNFVNCPKCLTPKDKGFEKNKDINWYHFVSKIVGPKFSENIFKPVSGEDEELKEFIDKNECNIDFENHY